MPTTPGTTRAARSAKARPSTRMQRIFTLPDMTKMQVKLNIHESLIKKIKVGQKAEIRIESFPSIVFVGTVTSVSQLADSTRPWMTGGVKQYPTVVKLDDLKGQDVKPGMTAEAKVHGRRARQRAGRARAGHRRAQGRVLRVRREDRAASSFSKVKIGENNETHVQILEGSTEGDRVALDARLRAAAEFKLDDQKARHDEPKPRRAAAPPRRRPSRLTARHRECS